MGCCMTKTDRMALNSDKRNAAMNIKGSKIHNSHNSRRFHHHHHPVHHPSNSYLPPLLSSTPPSANQPLSIFHRYKASESINKRLNCSSSSSSSPKTAHDKLSKLFQPRRSSTFRSNSITPPSSELISRSTSYCDSIHAHQRSFFVIAMHNFDAATDGDWGFIKGDQMEVLDATDSEWWLVRHLQTMKQGYVPRSYVARVGTLECDEWYFGPITRHQAEALLKASNLANGTFLVRHCSSTPGAYVVSIRDCCTAPEVLNPVNNSSYRGESCSTHSSNSFNCTDEGFSSPKSCASSTSSSSWSRSKEDCDESDEAHVVAEEANASEKNNNRKSSERNSHCSFSEGRDSGCCANASPAVTPPAIVYALHSPGCNANVKHYKIKPLDNNRGYFISTKKTFASLKHLVNFYLSSSEGLCCQLNAPCPRPTPRIIDLSPATRHQGEIPRSSLKLIRKLGSGQFGDVYYGLWNGNRPVAIKTVKPGNGRLANSMDKQAFLHEIAVMKKCDHDHLVRLYAFCTQEEPYLMVMEYLQNGCLLEYLRRGKGQKLKFSRMVLVAAQIASGMSYLEANNLIHRDLAARNILIGENLTAKIADFGLARVLHVDEKVYTSSEGAKFPIKWTAPEAALYKKFSIKSDVWSYAVVLYEIISKGQTPYPSMPSGEVIYSLQRGYRMPKPSNCPDAYYSIMVQCWNADPSRRPTFDFLYHFFADYEAASEGAYRDAEY